MEFDKDGVCNACNYSKIKKKINWKSRFKEFKKIVKQIKDYSYKYKLEYDCVVPWSGGKDSSSIALKLKNEYELKPLLVTFSPLIVNHIGSFNRELVLKKGFDTVFFQPNIYISKKLAKRFFLERGNPKVAWDAGINSIPLKIAIKFKIPFIFYAEHGESEYGGLVLDKNSTKIRNSREVIEHQIGDYPENWISDDISIADLNPYIYPNEKELKKNKIIPYYFSYFHQWSMFENYNYIKKEIPDFKENEYGRTEGTFTNFDSLDDKIDDLYYYMQFIKFGFGRATRDASRLIQNSHIDRKKAISYVKKFDGEFPKRNFKDVLKFLDISELTFYETVDKHRNLEIWKTKGNSWELKHTIK